MSLLLHLVSLFVFLAMLYQLRNCILQKSFLQTLLSSLTCKGNSARIDCPLAFLQMFAKAFNIEINIKQQPSLLPTTIRVRTFLEFYLEYGMRSILISRNDIDSGSDSGWIALITTQTEPTKSQKTLVTTSLGGQLIVKVSDLC